MSTGTVNDTSVAAGWHAHRVDLAKWTMDYMVNRTDAFGAYSRLEDRGKTGSKGKPIPKNYTEKLELTLRRLESHFSKAAQSQHVIGVHIIGLNDTCKAVSLDIDSHSSDEGTDTKERNLAYALAKFAELDRLGLRPLLWDSNGNGGFHIDVIFSEPIPAVHAFRFGQWLVRDWKEFGFVVQPESFPKQPSRKDGYGNWLRIVGRHHTRDVWATVYDSESGEWLSGEAAAMAVLAHQPVSPTGIPPEALVETKSEADRRIRASAPRATPTGSAETNFKRAEAYLNKIEPAISGHRGHPQTYKAAIQLIRFGLSRQDALSLLSDWNQSCDPPWSDAELEHKIDDAIKANPEPMEDRQWNGKPDTNGHANGHQSNGNGSNHSEQTESAEAFPEIEILWAEDMVRDYPEMRPTVIEGIARKGETVNIIAAPKIGKSWLAVNLALCVAFGLKWLGKFWTHRGKVLIVDNELHRETTASRLRRIAEAMNISLGDIPKCIGVMNVRGQSIDLNRLALQLSNPKFADFSLIILDAWYRFQPQGNDENSNSDVTALYNVLDRVASKLGVAFVAIHHTSKGNQASKGVTDVGSGAGAQSRAADSHLTIRQHEIDGVVVVDAAVRSFAPMAPFCLRWEYPVWMPAEDLDPKDLRTERPRKKEASPCDGDGPSAEETQRQKERQMRDRVLEAYRTFPEGETESTLRTAAKMSGAVFGPINAALIREGVIQSCKVAKNRTQYDGFKLMSDNPDNPDKSVSCPTCPTEGGTPGRTTAPPLGGGVLSDRPHRSDSHDVPEQSDARTLSDLELNEIFQLADGMS